MFIIVRKERKNMAEFTRNTVKVTVLDTKCYPELQKEYLHPDYKNVGPCTRFHPGQEFIFDNKGFGSMNHGDFCAEAWDCISRYIYAALQGGSIMKGWSEKDNEFIACCNDGTRPVIFKIERIEE